ncbi:MAG: DUF4421 domain-containing protein [Cyclobacteriaceae bacterium]|nr:DUF4421 domain-containing protein [Cyclobacteriaceae bacterium]
MYPGNPLTGLIFILALFYLACACSDRHGSNFHPRKGFSISNGYIANQKFSLRSLTSQTERQLKSAGSFLPTFHIRYYAIDDKGPSPGSKKSNKLQMSIAPGYDEFRTRVFYHLFVGISINAPDFLQRQMDALAQNIPHR